MAVVPVVHRSAQARAALRRSLPRRGVRVVACAAIERVETLLRREVVDAVVVDLRGGLAGAAFRLIGRYPGIPVTLRRRTSLRAPGGSPA